MCVLYCLFSRSLCYVLHKTSSNIVTPKYVGKYTQWNSVAASHFVLPRHDSVTFSALINMERPGTLLKLAKFAAWLALILKRSPVMFHTWHKLTYFTQVNIEVWFRIAVFSVKGLCLFDSCIHSTFLHIWTSFILDLHAHVHFSCLGEAKHDTENVSCSRLVRLLHLWH